MRTCLTFEALTQLPLVRKYEEAFLKATGIRLSLEPAGAPGTAGGAPPPCPDDPCWLEGGRPAIGRSCWQPQEGPRRSPETVLDSRELRCLAPVRRVSARIIVGGRHLATWVGGEVLTRRPTPDEIQAVARQVGRWGFAAETLRVREALFRARFVPADQFDAMGQLLTLFADHLGRFAESAAVEVGADEPRMVSAAKEYILAHLGERVSLTQVAAAVGASACHFCRVFRAGAGVKFTEFVARLRVERAKALLEDRSLRISEVAYTVGFGSIPQFNAVFRRLAGRSPTQFRAAVAGPGEMRSGPLPGAERTKDKNSLEIVNPPVVQLLPVGLGRKAENRAVRTPVIALPGAGSGA